MAYDDHLMTGVYAVDSFAGPDERMALELHLLSCEGCRVEARSLRETAGLLSAHASVPVPRSLRRNVLAEIARTPQEPPARLLAVAAAADLEGAAAVSGPGPRTAWAGRHGRTGTGRRPSRLLAAAAGLVLVCGAGLAGYGADQVQQAHRSADQAGRAQSQLQHLLALVADPAARHATSAAAGGGSVALSARGSEAAVVARALPALPAGRAYQLWIVRPGGAVSAGLAPDGAVPAWGQVVTGLRPGDAVAISVEPAAGSVQPTTDPVAVVRV